MELSLKLIAEFAQLNKIFSRRFSFFGDRWNCHQAQDRESWKRQQRFHFGAQFLGRETELAPLARDIDLKQNARMQSVFFGDSVYVLRERERIDAVDQFERRQRMANFIFLEVSNEMPANG